MTQEQQEDLLATVLKKVIDSNGYSFQYRLIKRIKEIKQNGSDWEFIGSEIPVSVHGNVIHADIILKSSSQRIYLIGECKRAEVSKSNWTFVKRPDTLPGDSGKNIYLDQFQTHGGANNLVYGGGTALTEDPIFDLPFEIKINKNEKQEDIDFKGKVLGTAVDQVLRASSGFINSIFAPEKVALLDIHKDYYFIPVVFTTANLYSSDVDISKSSLETGKLEHDKLEIKEQKWLWYNVMRSKMLQHELPHIPLGDIYKYMRLEYIRSVAIIGPKGIDDFLLTNPYSYLF